MTIKEIATLCNVDDSTVRKWITGGNGEKFPMIGEKCTVAFKTKKPADFTLDETLTIIRAGGNETLAALLADNAQGKPTTTAQPPLSAPLLHELRMAYSKRLISREEARRAMGLDAQPDTATQPAAEEQKYLPFPEERERGLRHYQSIAEAGGLALSDRDDLVSAYRGRL